MSPRCPPCVLWRWRERWLVVVVVFPFTFFRLSLVRVGSTVYLTRPRWPLLGGGAFGYTEATDSAEVQGAPVDRVDCSTEGVAGGCS